jgi:ATP-dependent Clp endopeptidase proteolytic subunit ClpP
MKNYTEPELDLIEFISQVHNYDLNIVEREIYLHSHFGLTGDEEGGIEYRMATQFIKNLHILNRIEKSEILLHFQSPGGDYISGMAIFDAIKISKSSISILVYGEVASMGTIVLQAAKNRVMTPNCELMIHKGFVSLEGNISTVQSNAAWNAKVNKRMLKILASRCVFGRFFQKKKMSESKAMSYIEKKLNKIGDWNLDAEEAVYYGFADGIIGNVGFENTNKLKGRNVKNTRE